MSKRIEKVNALIEKELGQIIFREIEFPQGVLATLTRVESSIDLFSARVYIGVLPQEKSKRVLEILNKMVFVLQKMLDKRLRMRPIPRIRFVEEKENVEAAKIDGILENLKKREK